MSGDRYTPDEGARILADVKAHPRRELIEAIAEATFALANEHGSGGGMWWHLSQAYVLVEALPALCLDEDSLCDEHGCGAHRPTTTDPTQAEGLDLDACEDNLGRYALAKDARSCRDIGLALLARVRELEAERDRFSGALGFGDNVSDPAASLAEMLDPIRDAMSVASDHHVECPALCELCGETLAATVCQRCSGSGCGPGTASGAYEECETCAGIGRIHEGCAEKSYADLAARVRELEAELKRRHGWIDRESASFHDQATETRTAMATSYATPIPDRLAAGELEVPAEPAPANDLMAPLRASLERARANRIARGALEVPDGRA